MKPILIISSVCMATLLSACSGQAIQRKDGTNSSRSFSLKELAKGDIDNVAETHQQEVIACLKTLTIKLYRRNPQEWRKGGFATAESAVDAVYQPLAHWQLAQKIDWQTSILNAWREDFTGDRVQALMSGLLVMNMAAYNHQTEFYLLSELDAQKLYNSARNLEAVVWKLSNAKNAHGEFFLLSNGADANGIANLSFEREFGKLIGIQDTLAKIIEDKSNRAIRFGLVNATTMIFLPI
ncbi:MAG: hypothetical protein ABL892_08165 [Thiobacillaceae bacterium]